MIHSSPMLDLCNYFIKLAYICTIITEITYKIRTSSKPLASKKATR